ncbi:uncharacterized protein LOC121876081 [Homarus americanus]|uniref:Lysosome-associated membrane glycoprotein 5 n=1 Tax=Homarus americanus TaxID=6706 RepID=A0A8J5JWF5_HOMAM|nr:uncharacterized protein LOC121876081 [Homarus americanus]KAG7160554.1 hypothetical protein Hamer_G001841 [Homarus americanus]
MATTWAAIISLGVVAVLAPGSSAATTTHVAPPTTTLTALTTKNVTTISNVSQVTSNQSQPKPQEIVQLSRYNEEKVAEAEAVRGDVEDELRTREVVVYATTPPTLHHPLVVKEDEAVEDEGVNPESDNAESDNEGDYDTEGNVVYKRGGSDRMEYEELPVPMAQKDSSSTVGYTRYDGTYIVKDEFGVGCVMAYFKSKATVYYLDTKGEYKTNQVSPSDDARVGGICDRVGQVSQVDVLWSSYILSLTFGLDDITDSWFVSRFSLTYNLSNPDFEDAAPGGGEVTLVSRKDRTYWQTTNSKSFRCLLLHDVTLKDSYNNSATLHFDEVRVQAFCDSEIFRTPKHCIHRVHRDEMVPVTVGAVLAGSTLLTVIGYGIFRYFKVKKVQYDTMQ